MRASHADLIGVQEALRPAAVRTLAERLGMNMALAWSPRGGHVALLSRWPIVASPTDSAPPMLKTLLQAQVCPPGVRPLRVFVTHLAGEYHELLAGEPRRLREVAYVLACMSQARATGEPQLLMGDFNSLAPGEHLRATAVLRQALMVDAARQAGARMDGLPGPEHVLPRVLRPLRGALAGAMRRPVLARLVDAAVAAYVPRAVIRRLLRAGYVDCYAALHPVLASRACTCPAAQPAGRIDYIFADVALARQLASCTIVADTPSCPVQRASDHRPVLAELLLPQVDAAVAGAAA